nr:hypothetical protein [uncultured bacterium]
MYDVQTLGIPGALSSYIPETCARWGLDGFAVLGNDATISIARWSGLIPADIDSNGDGIADNWEATYFNRLDLDPASDSDSDGLTLFQEYLFGTSPLAYSPNPQQMSLSTNSVGKALRLVFPRRAGLPKVPYQFVTSPDLIQWSAATNISESLLATQSMDGVVFHTVAVTIPATNSAAEFLRWKWQP